jgi:hypothetical protein
VNIFTSSTASLGFFFFFSSHFSKIIKIISSSTPNVLNNQYKVLTASLSSFGNPLFAFINSPFLEVGVARGLFPGAGLFPLVAGAAAAVAGAAAAVAGATAALPRPPAALPPALAEAAPPSGPS